MTYSEDCASLVNRVLSHEPDVCRCQAAIVFGHEPKCPEHPESHMTQPVPMSPWIGQWVMSVPVEQDDGLCSTSRVSTVAVSGTRPVGRVTRSRLKCPPGRRIATTVRFRHPGPCVYVRRVCTLGV